MIKRILFLAIILLGISSSYAQNNINEYKYIIVPNTFEFLKEADQYRLNSLTKFLFEKYEFSALMEEDDMPKDFDDNICLALKANVIDDSGMFKTKLSVQLKNCKGDIVFTSKEGTSREKKFAVAYNEALRQAFQSFKTLNYKYEPKETEAIVSKTEENVTNNQEIKQLKEEIKALKKLKENHQVIAQSEVKKATPIKVEEKSVEVNNAVVNNVLYAQKINNGFQLVDQTPKIIYSIKNTGLNNVFLVEGKEAIIYKVDANWVLEYYENSELKTKLLNIKF